MTRCPHCHKLISVYLAAPDLRQTVDLLTEDLRESAAADAAGADERKAKP